MGSCLVSTMLLTHGKYPPHNYIKSTPVNGDWEYVDEWNKYEKERKKKDLIEIHVCSIAQLCLILCDPMDCSPTRLLCPWCSPGKIPGLGCHAFLQEIFLIQGSNPSLLCLPHWQEDSLTLSHLGSCRLSQHQSKSDLRMCHSLNGTTAPHALKCLQRLSLWQLPRGGSFSKPVKQAVRRMLM